MRVLFLQSTIFALDRDYQLILWLALGWVISLRAAGARRCSQWVALFPQQRVSGGIAGLKVQTTWSGVFDQLMNRIS